MKIKLIFTDWLSNGKSIYNTEKGVDLSMGQFHSGTTFDAEIDLDQDDVDDLEECIRSGYTPVFEVALPKPVTETDR